MARISREQYIANKQKLDNHIWEVFKTEGWEAVSYARLAKFMCTRKSTIQGYYPSSLHFLEGIEGRAFPEMLPLMDMSTPESFLTTWSEAVKVPVFRNYLELFAMDATKGLTGKHAKKTYLLLKGRLAKAFDLEEQEAESLFRMAIGSAFAAMANEQDI